MKAITIFLLICTGLVFTSCGTFYEHDVAANGATSTVIHPYIGGTSTLTSANGGHFTQDSRSSFQAAATAATTIAGGVVAGKTARITNGQNNNATITQQLNQQNFQLQQQQLNNAATAAAAKTAQQNAARAAGVPALASP